MSFSDEETGLDGDAGMGLFAGGTESGGLFPLGFGRGTRSASWSKPQSHDDDDDDVVPRIIERPGKSLEEDVIQLEAIPRTGGYPMHWRLIYCGWTLRIIGRMRGYPTEGY